VIVSEAFARRYFPGESPIGRQVTTGNGPLEIVGVVGDIRRASLADAPRADLYFPFEHGPAAATTLFLRTTGDPAAALAPVRVALRELEPDVLVVAARTMDDLAAESAAVTRLVMRLLAGFALLALVLAAVGIYGVTAYSVRRRTRELGTRLALGARRQDIVRLVLQEGAVMTLTGLAIGLAGALTAARSLGSVLYGVSAGDPVSVAVSALVLGAAALLACGLPAIRASRVDPARTLASE
jgi:putative ABC transport system permease protein